MKSYQNKSGRMDIMSSTSLVLAGDYDNTPEERQTAARVICGARGCKDAAEAKLFLQMAGLIKEDQDDRQPEAVQG